MKSTIWKTAVLIAFGLAFTGVSTNAVMAFIQTGDTDSVFIDLEKYVAINGGAWQDADVAPGPEASAGSYVEFRFVITNVTPDRILIELNLTDDSVDLSGCSVPWLIFPAQSIECVVGPFQSESGQHTSTGTVTALSFGDVCADFDVANYFGVGDGAEPPGTASPGYWRNHPEAWPVSEVTVGGQVYTRDDAIEVMGTPPRGDKTFTMFRSLVAAMLNVLVGNDGSCITDVILASNEWMELYPVGSGVRAKSAAWQESEWLHEILDDYNNGLLCAPPRE